MMQSCYRRRNEKEDDDMMISYDVVKVDHGSDDHYADGNVGAK